MKALIVASILLMSALNAQTQTVQVFRDRKPCALTLQLFPFLAEEDEEVKVPWRPIRIHLVEVYIIASL